MFNCKYEYLSHFYVLNKLAILKCGSKNFRVLSINLSIFQAFHGDALTALKSMTLLDLSDNFYMQVINLDAISSLESLFLDGNFELQEFGRDLLSKKHLEISLKRMNWRRMPKKFPLDNLASLNLRGNPLICDCKSTPLKAFALKNNGSLIECWHPKSLRGRKVKDLKDEELICFEENEEEQVEESQEEPPLSSNQQVKKY